MTFVWTSSSFCSHLVAYQLKFMKGDIFVNNVAKSIGEIISYALSGSMVRYLGLKHTIVGS
jgi:hypothetical protein